MRESRMWEAPQAANESATNNPGGSSPDRSENPSSSLSDDWGSSNVSQLPTQDSAGRPLRIFMISYLYEPGIQSGMGGFQKVFELARAFSLRHRVTLFLPAFSGREADLDCIRVPVINRPFLRAISFNLFLIPLVLWTGMRKGVDLFYVRIFNSLTLPLLAAACRARLVVEFNGNPLQFYARTRSWKARMVRWIVSWNLTSADSIVALTEGLRSDIREVFGVPEAAVHVESSGSNAEVFQPGDRLSCRRILGLKESGQVAVFAGTFFAYQGIDSLLESLTDPRLAELDVLLLGDGPMRRVWERRVQELGLNHVQFTGQVQYERVPAYIAASDFCLAPFTADRGEVSPLKVMDYLFCARPVVISRIPPVENLLREFPSLVAFPAGDSGALAEAMITILEDPAEFNRRAFRDSERARSRYSWTAVAERLERASFRGDRS